MLECDYLVVGTGATGMAFADAVVSESADRTVILVDKLPEPGGHWNCAYDFVRLHQAACYYGVASEKLERDGETALYRYADLSSKKELLEYYRRVLDKLVATGRVRHFGECTYRPRNEDDAEKTSGTPTDDHSFVLHSFVDKEGITQTVKVKRRLVDATYLDIRVPSAHPPQYDVQAGVECVPVNGIYGMNAGGADRADKNKKFVLVGAGKTAIDAALYLLDVIGVHPDNITWIMPRDAWLANRDFFDPQKLLLNFTTFFNRSPTLEESLLQREAVGVFLRLDTAVWPKKYSCATVDADELRKLRTIRNVIRKGRVASITATHLIMADGADRIPYEPGSVFVDCSARGLPPRPAVPIFQPFRIVLQPIQLCMTCISAAAAGYVECHPRIDDDDDRNRLLAPVPYPDTSEDSVAVELGHCHNMLLGIGSDPRTRRWFENCRLNSTAHSSGWTLLRLFGGRFYGLCRSLPKGLDSKKAQYRKIHQKDFALEVYSPRQMDRMTQSMLMTTMLFYAVLFVVLTMSTKGTWYLLVFKSPLVE